jgi:hypothetical protein
MKQATFAHSNISKIYVWNHSSIVAIIFLRKRRKVPAADILQLVAKTKMCASRFSK